MPLSQRLRGGGEGARLMSTVVIRSARGRVLKEVVREVLDRLDWERIVAPHSKAVIKVNLCSPLPEQIESADTSPELIRAMCEVLLERTPHISVVEAHSYRFPAEMAFRNAGIYALERDLGVKVVNLSKEPSRDVGRPLLGPLPEILLTADVFVTMPVLKTHALTYFTGAIKNQWGCVPRYDRIALHHSLDQLLVDLNGILKPRLCVMDGIIGVEGRGPTNGKPRRLDLVLGSRDPVALDATAMRLVGLDPLKCRHVVLASEAGQGVFDETGITVDSNVHRDWTDFEPAQLDWAVDWMNRLTKYRWFREHILGVDAIFYPTKRLVGFLRTVGIVR
jgi:uncharacterized protein (DUF362 family)